MSNEEYSDDDYDDYDDDDLLADCPSCGTLNRFPGPGIPKILCYECGSIIDAPQELPPPPVPTPSSSSSSFPPSSSPPSPSHDPSFSASTPLSHKAKKKKKFSLKKTKTLNMESGRGGAGAVGGGGGGKPSITAPVFVKHVSGATQGDDVAAVLSENGMVLGGKPDPDKPVDIGRKSMMMSIPIGVEGSPLSGGKPGVSAPTNVKKNPDPLASIQAPAGKKPEKTMTKEEKMIMKEMEKMEKKQKRAVEKEAKKQGKGGIILEKRTFTLSRPALCHTAPPGMSPPPPSSPTSSPPSLPTTPPPPAVSEREEEEGEEGEEREREKEEEVEEGGDEDEVTEMCPYCQTLNAFPGQDVPQIACYNCGSAIDNPFFGGEGVGEGGEGEGEGEEGELQAFCEGCGNLNLFPKGVVAVACWSCENPIYYK